MAIDPPSPFRRALGARLESFKHHGADIKWVETHNLHLTLKFLGPTSSGLLEPLASALRAVSANARPFELTLGRCGAFPTLARPKVLWADIVAGRDQLIRIAAEAASAARAAGHPCEEDIRPYQAHLTLGRVRSPKQLKPLMEDFRSADFSELGGFLAEELVLLQSETDSRGPVYTPIEKFRFGAG